jgi:catechol 2,3-dioxygenase-like lactoylglutathione lyase family enzyme
MRKIQSQGVHHITLVGADRQTSIDFWEGLLGMPFIFDQPNLDNPNEGHVYFDPGDGRLITVFTNEERKPDPKRTNTDPGAVHHLAFNISQATFKQTVKRLDERGIKHSGPKDRGFMDSIYFKDPMGQGGLQHPGRASGRCNRIAGRTAAGLAVRRPQPQEPVLVYAAAKIDRPEGQCPCDRYIDRAPR